MVRREGGGGVVRMQRTLRPQLLPHRHRHRRRGQQQGRPFRKATAAFDEAGAIDVYADAAGCGGRGRAAQELVFGLGALEQLLQALVVGLQGGGAGFEGGEFGFEVFDVALFALAEGALAVWGEEILVGVLAWFD